MKILKKLFFEKINSKIFSKRYSNLKEGVEDLLPILTLTYHDSLSFGQSYHNRPFGFFEHTREKTMSPSELKDSIEVYNDFNKGKGIKFEANNFLENAKEVFEYTRPLLLNNDMEIQSLDLITIDCLYNLKDFYQDYKTKIKKHEFSLKDSRIDSFAYFETNDDLFTYVRVYVIIFSHF
jgi:hypothetical protein